MSEESREIQRRMRDVRADRKLTYDRLEEMTGIPHATLYRYFNGNPDKIPLSAIPVIAKAMGVSAKYILGWDYTDKEKLALEIAKIISPLQEGEQGLVLALAREVALRSKPQ